MKRVMKRASGPVRRAGQGRNVGLAVASRNAKLPRSVRAGDGFCVVQDTEYLMSLSLEEGHALTPSEIISNTAWSAFSNLNGRLARYCQLYEKYEVESLSFHFEGQCPTTQGGSYVAFFDYDVGDADNDRSLDAAYGHPRHVVGKFWENQSLIIPQESQIGRRVLFTSPNEGTNDTRLSYFGRLVVVDAGGVTATGATLPLLNVSVSYRLRFMTECWVKPTPTVAASESVRVAPSDVKVTNPAAVPGNIPISVNPITGVQKAVEDVVVNAKNVIADAVTETVEGVRRDFVKNVGEMVHTFASGVLPGTNLTYHNEFVRLAAGTYRWMVTFIGTDDTGEVTNDSTDTIFCSGITFNGLTDNVWRSCPFLTLTCRSASEATFVTRQRYVDPGGLMSVQATGATKDNTSLQLYGKTHHYMVEFTLSSAMEVGVALNDDKVSVVNVYSWQGNVGALVRIRHEIMAVDLESLAPEEWSTSRNSRVNARGQWRWENGTAWFDRGPVNEITGLQADLRRIRNVVACSSGKAKDEGWKAAEPLPISDDDDYPRTAGPAPALARRK